MTKQTKPASGGVAGVLFVCCAAAAAAGVVFDVFSNEDAAFWLGAQAGGAAAIGAGAAAFAVIAAYAARYLLMGGRGKGDGEERGSAGTDA